jgi:uncharacterized protein involved in exopolysaccharide biosynthesis
MAKYVEILFRHRLRFTALFLIPVALAATALVWFASFRATATMRIEDPSSFGATFVPIGWSPNLTPAQNLADSVTQVVKTPAFAQSLSDTLSSSGTISNSAELQQVVGSIGANLRIGVSGSHLMTLTYSCHKANLCAQVLGDAMAVFRGQLVQAQKAQADATSTFWKGQLKDAQASLALAEQALQSYAAANPGVTIDANSSDPQVVQLLDGVRQWKAKVVEAQDSLSLAQYLSTSSARFIEVGTTVVDTPHLASSRTLGDGSSLLLAALVLFGGLVVGLAYVGLLAVIDKTVRDARALERRLGVPVVATIPRLVSSRG